MGWLSKLFAPPVKALCVHIPGGYLIDLSPLPADCARVTNALRDIIGHINRAHEPFQIWVMPPHLIAHYWSEEVSTEQINDLLTQLLAASARAKPSMIVEPGTPPGFVRLLELSGITPVGPDVKLQFVDSDGSRREVPVMEQLAKIRAAGTDVVAI